MEGEFVIWKCKPGQNLVDVVIGNTNEAILVLLNGQTVIMKLLFIEVNKIQINLSKIK